MLVSWTSSDDVARDTEPSLNPRPLTALRAKPFSIASATVEMAENRQANSFDPRGDLLSATYAGGRYESGTVFALIPSNESWTERVLYRFTGASDGAYPLAGGPSGHFYGTTIGGGYGQGLQGDGVVFEVVP
jgi:hypothetical protein